MQSKLLEREHIFWGQNKLVAGIDEAGAGPLAGPVTAACVILDPKRSDQLQEVDDSKKLSAKKREKLAVVIKESALAWGIANSTVEEIDKLNILNASLLAMKRALEKALQAPGVRPHCLLVDARKVPGTSLPQISIVGGDQSSVSIAAASILAKVSRDTLMIEAARKYPEYGFERHKGYGTKAHLEALFEHGATEMHRQSFAPVQKAMLKRRCRST